MSRPTLNLLAVITYLLAPVISIIDLIRGIRFISKPSNQSNKYRTGTNESNLESCKNYGNRRNSRLSPSHQHQLSNTDDDSQESDGPRISIRSIRSIRIRDLWYSHSIASKVRILQFSSKVFRYPTGFLLAA